MALSLQLGIPLDEIGGRVSERAFRTYAAYLAHEPLAGHRLDWWMGQVIAAQLNPWRKKGKRAVKPADLIPDRWGIRKRRKRRARPRTFQQWREALAGFARALGGRVFKKGK